MDSQKVMLDTNIISYLLKNSDFALPYLRHFSGKFLFLSFISVGEIFLWAETANWGQRRHAEMEEKLRNYIVVPYDHEIARTYARIASERRRNGLPISLHDAWIAACAVRHGVPLVTHNAKDFVGITSLEVITEG
ncbi:MAG: ribonuclease VapC [Candidatus Hydrogenedentota bacterium]